MERRHIPALEIDLLGMQIDGEIEEVRDEGDVLCELVRQQDIEALDDQNVGPIDDDLRTGHDIPSTRWE